MNGEKNKDRSDWSKKLQKKNCNILLLRLSFSAGRMEIVLRGNVFIIEQKTSVTGEREFLSENFVPV